MDSIRHEQYLLVELDSPGNTLRWRKQINKTLDDVLESYSSLKSNEFVAGEIYIGTIPVDEEFNQFALLRKEEDDDGQGYFKMHYQTSENLQKSLVHVRCFINSLFDLADIYHNKDFDGLSNFVLKKQGNPGFYGFRDMANCEPIMDYGETRERLLNMINKGEVYFRLHTFKFSQD